MDYFFLLLTIAALLGVIYAANLAAVAQWNVFPFRVVLTGLAWMLAIFIPCGIQVLVVGGTSDSGLPSVEPVSAILSIVAAGASAYIGLSLLNSESFRIRAAARVPGFNPESPVHMTAALLSLFVIVVSLFQFVLGGGLEGVASSIETAGFSPTATLFETALWLIAAFLGVGYAIRRSMPATLERLGLRIPNRADIVVGIAAGLGFLIISIIYGMVWQMLSPTDMFAQQTNASDQLVAALSTIPAVMLLSASAALGEEIFMRGALQPVFGLWLTAGFFTVLHAQYLFTPAMLLIFAIGVGLGLVRQRVSTTSAIIAHFVYNVVPLMLVLISGGVGR